MKGNNSSGQIKVGMILSYINLGIGNIIPLVYTPIMLSLLGQSEYGLFKIASSTTSYLSLMAFGIGSAITRYLIKASTEGGKQEEENTFGLFHLIFQGIAVLTLIVGLVIVLNLDLLYESSIAPDQLNIMKILVAIMVVNTTIGFSATSYNAVVVANERFTFIQIVNILSTVGGPILNLIILYLGFRSIGMAIASLCLSVIVRILYVIYVRKNLDTRPRYDDLPTRIIREVFVFSFWVFISGIVAQLYASTDMIIIGTIPRLATMGAAVYSVGNTFPKIMSGLSQVTPTLFMPRANKMVFGGSNDDELTDLVIKVGRMQGYVVLLVCSGFAVFGQQFITWYVGEAYYEAYWVAIIIMVPVSIPMVQSAANSIMQAKNKHRFRALVYLLIACINVIATLLLVNKFGIIGAAIPTAVAYIIGNGFLMNWYYYKRINLDIPRFWKNLIPIFLVAITLSVCTLLISNYVNFYRLDIMILGMLVYSILYIALNWLFVINKTEKQMIISVISRFNVLGILKRRTK